MAVVLLAATGYLVHTRQPRTLQTTELGRLRLYPAWLRTRSFVYLFSDERGWSEAEERAARDLARAGARVIGIDSAQFQLWAERAGSSCLYMPGLLEDYSRAQQRALHLGQYLAPTLLGHGSGASLVYLTQLQAPPLAFGAAVAIDPNARLALPRMFCDLPALASDMLGQQLKAAPPGGNVPLQLLLDPQRPRSVASSPQCRPPCLAWRHPA